MYYVDKSWLVIGEYVDDNATTFIFRHKNQQDGELLYAFNGEVQKGTWEHFDYADVLLMEWGEERSFYHIGFLNSKVFILRKQHTEEYLFLANENEFQRRTQGEIVELLRQEYLLSDREEEMEELLEEEGLPESVLDIHSSDKWSIRRRRWGNAFLRWVKRWAPTLVLFCVPLAVTARRVPTNMGQWMAFWAVFVAFVMVPLWVFAWWRHRAHKE